MNCAETQVRLADDVFGEIARADHDALAEHLASCSVCAEERRSFEEAIALLRGMDWPVVEPVLAAPQRERVEARAAQPPAPAGWKRRRTIVTTLASLAAAGLVAAIALPTLQRAPSDDAMLKYELREDARYRRTAPPSMVAAPKLSHEQADKLSSLGYVQPGLADSAPKGGDAGIADGVEGGVEGGVGGGVVGGVPGFSFDGDMRPREHSGAPRDMFFEHKGTNPFVSTERDALSTFGLDVDTASYTVARNYLGRGLLPPESAVRVEEFVNAMPQSYEPPVRDTFAIHLEGAPSPFRPGYHLLRVGLKAREVRARERKPANLTFVIDVSGSMDVENRLGLVKRSLRLLVDRLDGRDRIGIVVYGSSGRVVLDPTPATDRSVMRAIDSLHAEGSTNLDEGLDLGYRLALGQFDPAATNRVVLCTDGVANNGITDPKTLLRRIHAQAQKRVLLTALGFGMGNYNDALLQQLADEGDGQYAYIDDDREAERFFLRDLAGVLEVVARDAKAQVEFDPSSVGHYRLLGYEKRDVADEDFRNDDVDGGEIGAGHAVTVLYELKLRGEGARLGRVNVRYLDPDSGDPRELARDVEDSDLRSRFEATSLDFRTAVVAARFAEHLRGSRWVSRETLGDLARLAERVSIRRDGPEASELVDLVRRAASLADGRRQPVR